MGKLSDIYTAYKRNLDQAQEDYEKSVKERAINSKKFYDEFFKNLIVNHGPSVKNPIFIDQVTAKIHDFFGKDSLNFVAIDGSCDKHNSNEFISFYGGAYGSRGTLTLAQSPPIIDYKKWEIDKDVSMVAFVPVPYSQLVEISDPLYEEQFLMTEEEKINLTNIHLQIMQLAEVFLAYNTATSSLTDRPDLILIDNSISTMLGSVDLQPSKVHLIGYPFDRRQVEISDIAIAQSHPFNFKLGIPSTKDFTADPAIISYLHKHMIVKDRAINLSDMEKEFEMDNGTYHMAAVRRLVRRQVIEFDQTSRIITPLVDVRESWEYTKQFFQNICKKVFLDKKENALKYPTVENGQRVMRWMDPLDIKFLIGVGLRALIEVCWEKRILLTGIVKDSQSRYLMKNYLGVCKLRGIYPELETKTFGPLPPTDRLTCETLPYLGIELSDPWGTIEFDSAFMTLYAEKDKDGNDEITGTFGSIVRPERLFLRSIFQFFARKKRENVLTGHSVFVDRLSYPELDLKYAEELILDKQNIGKMRLFLYKDNTKVNIGQVITVFLLGVLTKNHFPEVIGYPDPLGQGGLGSKNYERTCKGSTRKL